MSDVELDESELFNSAVSDEPETPVVTEEPVQQEEPAAVQEETPAADGLTAELPPIPPKPEWRLKEDAERARAAETELANERAEKAALRQRLEALERPAQKVEQTKPAKPDPLLDPEGYETYLDNKFEERRINDQREFDLRLTRQSNVEAFDKAYAESQRLKEARDPAFLELSQKMHNTNAPGRVLLDWHQQRLTQAEIGNDLSAYKTKLREEALKDPEFRKAAMEAWRAESQQPSNGRPRVDLPPSLNGASRSNAALRSSNDDVSDAELFAQTTG